MALRFQDSFDTYASADITQKYTNVQGSYSIGAGRYGNGLLLSYPGYESFVYKALVTSGNVAIIGVAFKIPSAPGTTHGICTIFNGTTELASCCITPAQKIAVYRGAAGTGTLLSTGANALSIGTYYYVEYKVALASGATGSYEVRVNGLSSPAELSGSSVQTSPSATTWDGFEWGPCRGAYSNMAWDDGYVLDGSGGVNDNFWGPVQIVARLPDGAGNYTQMTPSGGGNNYAKVNESSVDGDTTYVSETTVGEKDTYTFAAVGVTGAVKGVQTSIIARSDSSGGETIAGVWRINSTDREAAAQTLTTSYKAKLQTYDISPDSGSAWTISEIDGAEFGPKLVS